VPDEKVELDPEIFEEEIDVKKAFRYEKGQKFSDGVDKEFEKMKSGDMPNYFYEEDIDDDE
jgi:hypothetical protein